ncbi:MAG: biotin--[acetyl-CoA-carboxylase] ligase [Deltaproteobacteria bacterium]|nr:biotin--[acetyl-CoA-carboxylase] ligase [Deltaproteobacteria bacterium]
MDKLDTEKIKAFLGKSLFSSSITVYERLESTNNRAKELYDEGAEEGAVVLAEEQTAGRGRMDRKWLSPPNKNILISILLKPEIKIENIYSLTLAMAVAGIDAIKEMTGLSSLIKWPNDIYLNNKKLAGILTEFKVRKKTPAYVIVGMGLNVNWNPEQEPGILFPSTSILNETGSLTSRNRLLSIILKYFELLYYDIISERMEGLYDRCNRLSLITGREISVDTGYEIIKGEATGIDEYGALILKVQGGNTRKILNGDVSIRF